MGRRRVSIVQRFARALLCACLVASSWPPGVRSEENQPGPPLPAQDIPTDQAVGILETAGFFRQDQNNRLRDQIVRDGALTPFGQAMARMYRDAQRADAEEVERYRQRNNGQEPPAGMRLSVDLLNQHRGAIDSVVRSGGSPSAVRRQIASSLADMRSVGGADFATLTVGVDAVRGLAGG